MNAYSQHIFCEGAISPAFIAESIGQYSNSSATGAYTIFLGQVRADIIGKGTVTAITYTAYEELALEKMQEIRETIFEKYPISEMEVRHSLGEVAAGGICLFVLAASAHRKAAMEACNEIVERVKRELPIWGKEHLSEKGYQWKTNR